MVNFGQLNAQKDQPSVIEPRQLFQTLRNQRYEYLRDVQGDVLDAWHARRDAQDLIIKMNTGSGKTLVGLILLWSKLKEGKGPAIYLCPNNHLVNQVRREADEVGIRHVDFEGPRNNLFPAEFFDGNAILITNIYRLFNGLSVFQIAGLPDPVSVGSIVIDDAHTCINIAREQCTARFPVTSKLGERILGMFETVLSDQSVTMLADIHQHKRNAYLRVPYWSWQQRIFDVARLFSENSECAELRFVWPLFRSQQVLANSTVVVSGTTVEISPYVLPISLFPSFRNAPHKVYMSATLIEDSALVRDFGANPESVQDPIVPKTRGDIGERLIIIPSLVDTRIEDITATELVSAIQSMHGVNTVALVPSAQRGKIWQAQGFTAISGEKISGEIQKLTNTSDNKVVIANRYDGIDLPDDACRLLVLDALPDEHRLANLVEASARQDSPILKKQKAQRIEQGMGRGVRSHTDYCVVVLTGSSLLRFMSQVDNQQFFSTDTKRQIEIGKGLCQILRTQDTNGYDAIIKLASQCLERDPDWRTYHRNQLQNQSQSHQIIEEAVSLASAEFSAWNSALRGQYQNAADTIASAMDGVNNISEADKGWFLQLEASYLHQIDRVDAAQKQLKAHELNPRLLKPLDGVNYRRIQARQTDQAHAVLQYIQRVTEANALICEVEDVLTNLEFGIDHQSFEAAFNDLATIIGFESQRPEGETNQGPDVLWWMTNDHYLVTEAKQEVLLERQQIYKSEAAQLDHSETWFEQHYPGKAFTPVLIHPCRTLAADAYLSKNAKVVQPAVLRQLVQSVRGLAGALATKPPSQWTVPEVAAQLLAYQLRPQDLLPPIHRQDEAGGVLRG